VWLAMTVEKGDGASCKGIHALLRERERARERERDKVLLYVSLGQTDTPACSSYYIHEMTREERQETVM